MVLHRAGMLKTVNQLKKLSGLTKLDETKRESVDLLPREVKNGDLFLRHLLADNYTTV